MFRVDSVDVLPDKSMRVNFIITNDAKEPDYLRIKDTSKIHLISDSLERVSGVGKPEGQWAVSQYGAIEFAPDDSIKISFQFPAFQKETRMMNLIFYEGAVENFSGVQIKNLALFTKQ